MKAAVKRQVSIGLGANLEDPENQVLNAIEALRQAAWLEGVEASSLYRSKPVGPIEQPEFINAVCVGYTYLSEKQVLKRLNQMESDAGRLRLKRWGPRILDLDILMMSDDCFESETLQVPHPEMHKRAFVLVPLCTLRPDWLHPVSKLSVQQMLNRLPTPLNVESIES